MQKITGFFQQSAVFEIFFVLYCILLLAEIHELLSKFKLVNLKSTCIIGNCQCYTILKPTFLSVMMQPGPCGQIIRLAKKHMQV